GGWTNWKMTRHHGTVAAAEIQYEVQKKSILEAEVAQDDWWIKKITAANDEI
nr:hypothetical protein [Tanacetum cinerariifolium]